MRPRLLKKTTRLHLHEAGSGRQELLTGICVSTAEIGFLDALDQKTQRVVRESHELSLISEYVNTFAVRSTDVGTSYACSLRRPCGGTAASRPIQI